MIVKKLNLTNFRNHTNLKIHLDPKISLITGNNASGKTTVLEAMHLIATSKSFRADYDKELIKHGEDFAKAYAEVIYDDTSDYQLEMSIISRHQKTDPEEDLSNASTKKVTVNKVAKSVQSFSGILNTVMFSPENIQILTGSPGDRRKYLDMILFQIDKPYKRAHASYLKALRQRNKVLELIRDFNRGQDQIEFWNEKLIESGQLIQNRRQELIEYLGTKSLHYNNSINAKKSHLELIYKVSNLTKERLRDHQSIDIQAKATLIGPHRDDMEVLLDGFTISSFGSRGQQRSALLALKLSEIDFLMSKTHEKPVLLLDDIFSELDENHREAVLKTIDGQQTVITSAEKLNFLDKPFQIDL